jgi:hypothetical protein
MPTFTYANGDSSFELDTSDAAFMAAFVRTVADRGTDYRYVRPDGTLTCVNVDTDKDCGSCLIGAVLVKMGVPVQWFVENRLVAETAEKLLSLLGFSPAVQGAARDAQLSQDRLNSWGVASDVFFSTYFDPDRIEMILSGDYIY